MQDGTTMQRPGVAVAYGVVVMLLVSLAPPGAADLKVASPVFDRGVFFKDNGNVRPLGQIFEDVPAAEIRLPYTIDGGGFEIRNASGALVAALIDNHIFLTGRVWQHQNTFPGKVRVDRVSGAPIASFDAQGNLYVDNVIEQVTNCVPPVWEGEKWNGSDSIQYHDNCYNYANNQLTYTYAQPGRASGYPLHWPEDYTVVGVMHAALHDGLSLVAWSFPGNQYTCPNAGTLVFLAVDEGHDYHWYRLDKANGRWTHKPGGTEATDRDASHNLIFDPLMADRDYGPYGNNYSQPGGFYCTCGSDARVR